jgi:hypothetical protein
MEGHLGSLKELRMGLRWEMSLVRYWDMVMEVHLVLDLGVKLVM